MPLIAKETANLDLHLRQAMLPDSNIRRDTVLAVVEQDNHAIRVHGLADEELVVFEVADDLLGVGAGLGLEGLDFFFGGILSLERFLDLLHVGCVIEALVRVIVRILGEIVNAGSGGAPPGGDVLLRWLR
jgi:hypothetical protein